MVTINFKHRNKPPFLNIKFFHLYLQKRSDFNTEQFSQNNLEREPKACRSCICNETIDHLFFDCYHANSTKILFSCYISAQKRNK